MKLKLQATTVYLRNYQSKARILCNEGSSRSSKTYSLAQLAFTKLMSETGEDGKGIKISCVRKTLPALKASAYLDFLEVVKKDGAYDEKCHNKTDLTYTIGNNVIEFFSIDSDDKVKSRKRDYLWIVESNELSFQEFTQLALRTSKQIYLEYNPSHEDDHWLETQIKTRPDCLYIHSTYKDNPFLDQNTIFEIERLETVDKNLWNVYGLGIRGFSGTRIYTHFQLCDSLPEEYDERIYGIDFGFNNETAVGELRSKDDNWYIKELVYEKGLTNSALITKLKEDFHINGLDPIYCDSAEPQRIEEMRKANLNAIGANKEVKKGIDTVKSKRIFLTKDSTNAIKESNKYSWKVTTDGKVTDEPVKAFDHFMDGGIRYPIHTHSRQPFIGFGRSKKTEERRGDRDLILGI